jgi:hypothetical protein
MLPANLKRALFVAGAAWLCLPISTHDDGTDKQNAYLYIFLHHLGPSCSAFPAFFQCCFRVGAAVRRSFLNHPHASMASLLIRQHRLVC